MRRQVIMPLLLAALPWLSGAAPTVSGGSPPRLSWPVDCELGRTCFIQRYTDRDPGPGARDYTCGTATQDNHNGTDIRVRDMADERRGVNVLAAADGVVARLRDGQIDVSVRERGIDSVKGSECGNGVVIGHGQDWETQYCHLAQGSITVKVGQVVKAGDPIGRIGLSGETEFPHVHLSVRHGGAGVDPFAPDAGATGSCGGGASLWRSTPPYKAREVINVGFTPRVISMGDIEGGDLATVNTEAPIVAAYARAINLKERDVIGLTLYGADGKPLATALQPALSTSEAQRFVLAGKRRPPSGWSRGVYKGLFTVKNGDKIVLTRSFEATL